MKGLKSAVAVMSILIVLALGLLGYGIYKRFGGSAGSVQERQAQADADLARQRALQEQERNTPPTLVLNGVEVSPAPEGLKHVTLPPRSTIRQMMPYKNGVALHTRTTKGEYIFYINTATGKMEGALKINYAPVSTLSPAQKQPQKQSQPAQPRK